MKQLSAECREIIIRLFSEGYKKVKIAKILDCTPKTVYRILKTFEETDRKTAKTRNGRKNSLSPRSLRKLVRLIKQFPRDNLKVITTKFNQSSFICISYKTVHRQLAKSNYVRRVLKKDARISGKNRKFRIFWCRNRSTWNFLDWRQWIFSDECQVVLNSDNKIRIWRPKAQPYGFQQCLPKSQRKISVMIWACVTFHGVKCISKLTGKVDSRQYSDVLARALPNVIQSFCGDPYVFQQDNASIHTSAYTRQFFHLNNIQRSTWPAQSPDINIIENIWLHCKRELKKNTTPIQNADQLFQKFSNLFHEYPQEKLENLYDSLPRRMREVVRMKGHMTKY